MEEKLILTKRLRGEDSYQTFTVRMKNKTVDNLNSLAAKSNRSRNELINTLLDFAIDRSEIKELL